MVIMISHFEKSLAVSNHFAILRLVTCKPNYIFFLFKLLLYVSNLGRKFHFSGVIWIHVTGARFGIRGGDLLAMALE